MARVQNCPDITIFNNLCGEGGQSGQGGLGGLGDQGGQGGQGGQSGQSGQGALSSNFLRWWSVTE